MHRRNGFLKKLYIFGALLVGLSGLGFTYAKWHASLFAEAKVTSGVMDVLFAEQEHENYGVSVADIDGNDISLIEAEFKADNKEVEILFNEGLPINQLIEGKLLKLKFPVSPSDDSTVTKLNYTKFDPSKEGEILELNAEKAILVNAGTGYYLGESEGLFTEPLKFEIYKVLSDNKEKEEEDVGQIYLKLQEESLEKLATLPTDLKMKSDELVEYTDLELNEQDFITKAGNGVVVTYSLEIPFDIWQNIPKSQSEE